MTDKIVQFRKKQIDEIVNSATKSGLSASLAGWRLVMMASSINKDAIMGIMAPEEGVTEEERVTLQDYNKSAFDRLRV